MNMAGKVVAYLEVVLQGREPDETQSDIEIRGSEQFFLGRNESICRQAWPDLVISNKHLRIHCVIYEQNPVAEIPPFVYATDLSTNGTYLKKADSECASSQGRGIRMGRNGTFLLDDGDELILSDSVTLIYRSVAPVRHEPLTEIQQREKQLFSSRYLVTGRVLGAGGFGKVMVAIHQKTQRQLACKIIDLRKLWSTLPPWNRTSLNERDTDTARERWPSQVTRFFREFEVLNDLSHPNIIAIKKVFWSSDTIYILQDLVSGGDLFSYLEYKGGRLNDVESALILRQILKGVEYLHNQDIVHRDLKPDNILMSSLDQGTRVVISDFGSARYLPNHQNVRSDKSYQSRRLFSNAGTLEYAAPEIHKANKTIPPEQGYSKSVDMWSVGAITGTLLSGGVIFFDDDAPQCEGDYNEAFLALASKCDLSFLDDRRHLIWRNVGSNPKNFIKNLLVLHEDRRMTATEALAHAWFTNKAHAAAFDEFYERAIRDWQPRHKDCRLVESISEISAKVPEALVSQRFLSQDVVSRHFAPPHRQPSGQNKRNFIPASQLRRTKTPLPSIIEENEHEYAQEESPSPQFDVSAESSHLGEDPMDDSMEQLSLGPVDKGRYTADNDDLSSHDHEDMQEDDSNIRGPIKPTYDFSVPEFPPRTPEIEEDSSSVVPETPMPSIKRPRDWPTVKSVIVERDEVEAEERGKRRKTRHEVDDSLEDDLNIDLDVIPSRIVISQRLSDTPTNAPKQSTSLADSHRKRALLQPEKQYPSESEDELANDMLPSSINSSRRPSSTLVKNSKASTSLADTHRGRTWLQPNERHYMDDVDELADEIPPATRRMKPGRTRGAPQNESSDKPMSISQVMDHDSPIDFVQEYYKRKKLRHY